MAQAQLTCPNCGTAVDVGDVVCPNCGVNLKSGESYEERVKKATGKLEHPEKPAGGLFVGLMVVLGIALFGGYMMQKRAEDILRATPEMFVPRIRWIQRLQDEMAGGDKEQARAAARSLIDGIDSKVMDMEMTIQQREQLKGIEGPGYNEKAAMGLLKSLKLKAGRTVNLKGDDA